MNGAKKVRIAMSFDGRDWHAYLKVEFRDTQGFDKVWFAYSSGPVYGAALINDVLPYCANNPTCTKFFDVAEWNYLVAEATRACGNNSAPPNIGWITVDATFGISTPIFVVNHQKGLFNSSSDPLVEIKGFAAGQPPGTSTTAPSQMAPVAPLTKPDADEAPIPEAKPEVDLLDLIPF